MLHSLGNAQTEYTSKYSSAVQLFCERNDSICVTPMGRGPDSWYLDLGELDFWEVWRSVAQTYAVDPERTKLYGFSMGGFGVWWLSSRYPDLFAKAVSNAGTHLCGSDDFQPVPQPNDAPGTSCYYAETIPLLPNLRWLPRVIVHGAQDPLLFPPNEQRPAAELARLGYRYRFLYYANGQHEVLDPPTVQPLLAGGTRTTNPGHVTFVWYPGFDRTAMGLVTPGSYWISGVAARNTAPGVTATIDAVSGMRPEAAVTPVPFGPFARTGTGAQPYTLTGQDWRRGGRAAAAPLGSLTLTNTKAAVVDLAGAGFGAADETWRVSTDGPTSIRFLGAARTFQVLRDGAAVGTTSAARPLTIGLTSGRHAIRLIAGGAGAAPAPVVGQLPRTGLQPGLATLAVLVIALALVVRRRRLR
jgi:hypothetical protein